MAGNNDLLFGKSYEGPAARTYAEAIWPGCEVRPAGTFADIDFLVFAGPEGVRDPKTGKLKNQPGEFIAFLEVKARRCTSEKYDSTIVATRKFDCARWGKFYFKVPSHCLVVFTDKAGAFLLHEEPDSREDIARWDRPNTPSVPHVHYKHTRLEWPPNLLSAILAQVALEQGLEKE